MATVTIIIRGVALSYHKGDSIWRVLFPFDNCHTVKLGLKENEDGMSLAAENRQIIVRVDNPDSGFGTGLGYDEFFDLTASYSHAEGIKMKSDWAEHAVLMTLENAVLSEKEATKSKFIVKEGETITKEAKNYGYSGKAELKGERITLEVTGENGFKMVFDRDATLVFDNDCLNLVESPEVTDMDMIYTILEDKNNPETKFTVERESQSALGFLQPSNRLPEKITEALPPQNERLLLKTNPNPGEVGVLCHKLRLSNVTNSIDLP